jgi:hypothetical protein
MFQACRNLFCELMLDFMDLCGGAAATRLLIKKIFRSWLPENPSSFSC